MSWLTTSINNDDDDEISKHDPKCRNVDQLPNSTVTKIEKFYVLCFMLFFQWIVNFSFEFSLFKSNHVFSFMHPLTGLTLPLHILCDSLEFPSVQFDRCGKRTHLYVDLQRNKVQIAYRFSERIERSFGSLHLPLLLFAVFFSDLAYSCQGETSGSIFTTCESPHWYTSAGIECENQAYLWIETRARTMCEMWYMWRMC